MTLQDLNNLPPDKQQDALYLCCGSARWVEKMLEQFPMEDLVELLDTAEKKWLECTQQDWKEAFAQHPRIGNAKDVEHAGATATWVAVEQAGVNKANNDTLSALEDANHNYYQKFGYIFIVCATGRSAEEMLALIISRLNNTQEDEIHIAAEEQNKITKLRLMKLIEA